MIANDVLVQLFGLFTSNSAESIKFLTYVRTYINKFAFTSFEVTFDWYLCNNNNNNKGIYIFQAHGQIYHYINDLLRLDRHPSYLQLYFFDNEYELENRVYNSGRLNPSIIAKLMDILHINLYYTIFRTLGDVPNLENHTIHIRSDIGLDQRVYNAQSVSQVAVLLIKNKDSESLRDWDIVVFNYTGQSRIVQFYFGCYNILQYPLFFHFSNTGWHQGIQIVKKGQHCHMLRKELQLILHNWSQKMTYLQKNNKVEFNTNTLYFLFYPQIVPLSNMLTLNFYSP